VVSATDPHGRILGFLDPEPLLLKRPNNEHKRKCYLHVQKHIIGQQQQQQQKKSRKAYLT
jgi:hypothetical protein